MRVFATFYGLGKTNYMFFEAVVTNVIYYGAAFIAYKLNLWSPSLIGIALLFGIGNAFDSIVSFFVKSIAHYTLLAKSWGGQKRKMKGLTQFR